MIIFLVTNRGLAHVPSFSFSHWLLVLAQKDIERKRKERKKRDEKRILTFSRSLSLARSFFLFPKKNRLIVSFYKFPRLSFCL
jgi:hypothetical protein